MKRSLNATLENKFERIFFGKLAGESAGEGHRAAIASGVRTL